MKIIDEAGYQAWRDLNTKDPYSAAVVTYLERWANLMETEIADGKTVAEVAEQTSYKADTEGITGFMHSAAVGALARYWMHGGGLRRWHNIHFQIGNEGERANASGATLNTALISVDTGEVPA